MAGWDVNKGHTGRTKDTNEEVNTYRNPVVDEAVQGASRLSRPKRRMSGMWCAEIDKGGRWTHKQRN